MAIEIGKDDLLMRLLDATQLRQRVIAGNLSNVSTPGYRRQVVRFEELLRVHMARGGRPEGVGPLVLEDVLTPPRPDGNNVNVELETNALRENRLLFETYMTILEGRFSVLQASLQGA